MRSTTSISPIAGKISRTLARALFNTLSDAFGRRIRTFSNTVRWSSAQCDGVSVSRTEASPMRNSMPLPS